MLQKYVHLLYGHKDFEKFKKEEEKFLPTSSTEINMTQQPLAWAEASCSLVSDVGLKGGIYSATTVLTRTFGQHQFSQRPLQEWPEQRNWERQLLVYFPVPPVPQQTGKRAQWESYLTCLLIRYPHLAHLQHELLLLWKPTVMFFCAFGLSLYV